MAIQTVEFAFTTGQTIGTYLYPIGSDVVQASGFATEATNRKTLYTVPFTDAPAGRYTLQYSVNSVGYGFDYVSLILVSGTYRVTPNINVAETLGTVSTGAAGYVGIDWSKVNSPTSYNSFTNTAISGVNLPVVVGTNNDKTGYSLTQIFPTNFSSLSIDTTGRVDIAKILGTTNQGAAGYVGIDWSKVTNSAFNNNLTNTAISGVNYPVIVGTNNDKTGYSLSQVFPPNFSVLGIMTTGKVSGVVLTDTSTVNTDMRGTDSAALATNYTAARAVKLDNLDATITSRSTVTVDQVWAKALTELAVVPGITTDALSALNWIFTLARNRGTQTSTTQIVLKDDSVTTLGTATTSDDGTTFIRGKFA